MVEENAGVSMIRGGEVVSMVEEVSGTNFGHGSRMRTNVSYSSFSVRTLPPIMVMVMEAAGSQKRVKQGKCEVSDISIIFVFVDIKGYRISSTVFVYAQSGACHFASP